MTTAAGWRLEWRRADAGTLHAEWPAPSHLLEPALAVCLVDGRPALVLGSTQSKASADDRALRAAGVDLVVRGSGGGAVLVTPGGQVWVDVWVPRGDPRWDDDIVRAPRWLGEAWCGALGSLGVADLAVHHGRSTHTEWSAVSCYAGIGPGEVTAGGRKVVGVSQRRTRHGARISTMAPLAWEPNALADLLALDVEQRRRLASEISGVAVGLLELGLPGHDASRLVTDALLAELAQRE